MDKNCYISVSRHSPLYCVPVEKKGGKWFIEYFIDYKKYEAFLLPDIELEAYKGMVIRISLFNSKYDIKIL